MALPTPEPPPDSLLDLLSPFGADWTWESYNDLLSVFNSIAGQITTWFFHGAFPNTMYRDGRLYQLTFYGEPTEKTYILFDNGHGTPITATMSLTNFTNPIAYVRPPNFDGSFIVHKERSQSARRIDGNIYSKVGAVRLRNGEDVISHDNAIRFWWTGLERYSVVDKAFVSVPEPEQVRRVWGKLEFAGQPLPAHVGQIQAIGNQLQAYNGSTWMDFSI